MNHCFTVRGRAVGKQRARVAFGHAYTPEKTRSWESLVGWYISAELMQRCLPVPLFVEGHVTVVMDFYLSGKRIPDSDNLAKSCMDGSNGILWTDDNQVRDLHIRVHACPANQQRVEIEVSQ